MFVPLIFFLGSLSYAVCVNFVPAYVNTMDALTETDVGLHGHRSTDEETASGTGETQEKNAVLVEQRE